MLNNWTRDRKRMTMHAEFYMYQNETQHESNQVELNYQIPEKYILYTNFVSSQNNSEMLLQMIK